MHKNSEVIDPFPKNPDSIPRGVTIQIHNSCNSKCIMCAYKDTHKNESYTKMSMQLFTKIVDEFLDLGIKRFALSLQCEPLHNLELFKMISYIKNNGANCGICSNGLLLSREIADKLFESRLNSLTISLNAVTEKTFKYVYGVSGLDDLIKNITYVANNKPDHLFFRMSSMLIKRNYSELTSRKHEIFEIIENNNIGLAMGPIGNHCGDLSNYSELIVVPEQQSSNNKLYCHDILCLAAIFA